MRWDQVNRTDISTKGHDIIFATVFSLHSDQGKHWLTSL